MKLNEFEVESWMTEHELDCLYNLTETSIEAMNLNDLQKLCKEDISSQIMAMPLDYGPIVGSNRLKKGILSLYEKGTNDNIAITHGAINGNELVMMTLLDKGDHVISLYPTYQQMYDFPRSIGCEVSLIELKEEHHWMPTLDDFKKAFKENTKMICLNSPNNPTGTTIPFSLMKEIIELARSKDCYILCDEIYRGINSEGDKITPSFSDYYSKAIVTSSLSKIFAFAGLRLGWIKGSKEVIDLINYRRDYHIISSGPFSDYIAALVLENKEEILKRNKKICKENKDYLKEWLKKEPHISGVIPDEGTVCFLRYDMDIPSKDLCLKLQEETGVFFVPGSSFNIENHIRYGFTHNKEYTKKGLEVFSNWLRQFDE